MVLKRPDGTAISIVLEWGPRRIVKANSPDAPGAKGLLPPKHPFCGRAIASCGRYSSLSLFPWQESCQEGWIRTGQG